MLPPGLRIWGPKDTQASPPRQGPVQGQESRVVTPKQKPIANTGKAESAWSGAVGLAPMFTPARDFLLKTPWRIIIHNPNVSSHSL
jgi:hypothetical protein